MKFLLLLLTFITFAHAQEVEKDFRFSGKHYSISYKLEDNLQTVRLHGEILSGIVEDLSGFKHVASIIQKDIPVKFVLYSGGGYLEAIKRLLNSMKRNCDSSQSDCKITTIIPGYAYCASACLNMFMIGDERIAGKYSRFGFHQGAMIPGALKIPGFAQKTLRTSGVNADWLKEHKELFSSLEISWMYPNQMDGSDMITGMSEAYEY